jgi:hypothetical protein
VVSRPHVSEAFPNSNPLVCSKVTKKSAPPNLIAGIALISTWTALGLVVRFVIGQGSTHFTSPHSWVGLIALCLSVLAGALGIAAHLEYDPNRASIPWWPDIFHAMAARLAFILGIVASFLGLKLYGASLALPAGLGLLLAVFLAVFLAVEIYQFVTRKGKKDSHPPYQSPLSLQD